MKKSFITLAAVAALLAACNGNTQQNSNGQGGILSELFGRKESVTFAPMNRTVNIAMDSLQKDSPKFSFDISLNIAASGEQQVQENINRSILRNALDADSDNVREAVDAFINNMREEYLQLRPEYLNDKAINSSAEWFNYYYNISSAVDYGRDNVINYTLHSTIYTGGAHGSDVFIYMNFDPATGNEIALSDLFKEDSENVLTERLTQALGKKIGAASMDEIHEKGYLILNDMYPTDNFILKNDSIIFYYNNYDIAPYYLGPTRLALSYEELKDILK